MDKLKKISVLNYLSGDLVVRWSELYIAFWERAVKVSNSQSTIVNDNLSLTYIRPVCLIPFGRLIGGN